MFVRIVVRSMCVYVCVCVCMCVCVYVPVCVCHPTNLFLNSWPSKYLESLTSSWNFMSLT